jgi:hypothetical protein
MRMVIVPNCVRDAIDAALDKAIAECPGAQRDREMLFGQLLDYFDEHGVVPDFRITPPADGSR